MRQSYIYSGAGAMQSQLGLRQQMQALQWEPRPRTGYPTHSSIIDVPVYRYELNMNGPCELQAQTAQIWSLVGPLRAFTPLTTPTTPPRASSAPSCSAGIPHSPSGNTVPESGTGSSKDQNKAAACSGARVSPKAIARQLLLAVAAQHGRVVGCASPSGQSTGLAAHGARQDENAGA